jgi:hypothetical protein
MELTGHGLMLELAAQSTAAREARDFERKAVLDEAVAAINMRVIGVPLAEVQERVARRLMNAARDPKYPASLKERYRDAAEFIINFG